MKVLLDLYKIKNPYNGLGQFSIQLLESVMKINSSIDWHGLVPAQNNIILPNKLIQHRSSIINNLFRFTQDSYSLWHSLQQQPIHLPNKKTPHLVTIHDLNFIQTKNYFKQKKYLFNLQKLINNADEISTISNYTRKQVEEYCKLGNKKISVIYNGVEVNNQVSYHTKYKEYSNYFFSIGEFTAKKNFHFLLDCLPFFEGYKLVIAGNHNTPYGLYMKNLIHSKSLHHLVELTGIITTEEKYQLYTNCTAFLFPSLAEGFGMPIVEALRFGKPVISSNACSLPEIGGNAVMYFDASSIDSAKNAIESMLILYNNSNQYSTEMSINRSNEFTWKRASSAYLDIYETYRN